jgi:hypothetical protein
MEECLGSQCQWNKWVKVQVNGQKTKQQAEWQRIGGAIFLLGVAWLGFRTSTGRMDVQ